MKELGGRTGVLVGLDLPLVGGGTEAGGRSPHWGNCLGQRRKVWSWEWSSWSMTAYMGWESENPCHSHIYRDAGTLEAAAARNQSIGIVEQYPGEGCYWLTAGRLTEWTWGRRLWREMPVQESQSAMQVRQYCWVMHRNWSQHSSFSLHVPSTGIKQ